MNALESDSVFVHRDTELGLAKEKLSEFRAGKLVVEPVLYFSGVSMVGKSSLLRKIKQTAIQSLIPSALIDFADESVTSARERLVRDIMKQWEATAEVGPFEPIASGDNADEVAERLVAYASQLHRNARPTPVALFLDTLEFAERETFAWLQECVLVPILDMGKAFLALTARSEYFELGIDLGWPIARRTRFLTLEGFEPKHTADHFYALKRKSTLTPWQNRLLSNPNKIALGIPGLNEIIFHRSFEMDETAIGFLVEEVIFKRAAAGNVDDEIRDILLTMAAFRKFDYHLLAYLANHFWTNKYPEVNRNTGFVLARRLKITMLLEARQDGGFVVSPSLRLMLDDHQRNREKHMHFETHCLAYSWFQREVEKGDFLSITDQLYHLTGAWFDLQQDEENVLKYPEELPALGKDRISSLLEIAEKGFKHIIDKSRADIQVEKVLNAFQQEKKVFLRFLSENEMNILIRRCHHYLEQVIQMADDHDNQRAKG